MNPPCLRFRSQDAFRQPKLPTAGPSKAAAKPEIPRRKRRFEPPVTGDLTPSTTSLKMFAFPARCCSITQVR
jgi:hypothetical protein